jgi:GNAT superfamily N-acetyltransferase
MPGLHIESVEDDATIKDWQHVHNVIIPADPLTLDEVRERVQRHRLEVAYQDDVLVGCTTVRPPADGSATATVIVRVLPEHRRRGIGAEFYRRALEQARALGAGEIETIVWAANVDGLDFACSNGFVEVSRYLPPDDDVEFITLRLA